MSDDLRGDFFGSESEAASNASDADARAAFFDNADVPAEKPAAKTGELLDSPERIAADMKVGKLDWEGYAKRMAAWERSKRATAPEESAAQFAGGLLEAPLAVSSGLISSAGGGLRGLYNLATGEGLNAAADAVRGSQDLMTYSPRTETGQALVRVASSPTDVAHAAIESGAEAAGHPELAPLISGGADIAATLYGGRAGLRGIKPGESPTAPIGEAGASETPNAYARESVGAAAVVPNLERASAATRDAIHALANEGEPVNRETVGRRVDADSLPIPMRLTRGQLTQDPALLSQEQNARARQPEFAQHFQEQNQQLVDNLDEIRASAAPNVVGNDHVQNGQALIDAYKAADEPMRANITQLYKKLETANGGQFPVNGKAFVEAADKALAKKLKGRYVPGPVAGVLDDLREGGAMTFENFENLRTDLAAEARKADRSGDGNAAAAVNVVREALESLPIEGEAAKLKPIADAARSAAKARFAKLDADPAYRAAVDDSVGMGEASPLADDFISKHVIRGKAANIKQMRENLAADPTANETIAAGAMNYLKSKSGVNIYTNEGNFSQAGYNKALAEVTPRLGDLVSPEHAQQLQQLGNVARLTQAQPRGSFVNNSNTFVAAAGRVIGHELEKIPGAGIVKRIAESRAEKKFVRESLTDVKLKDLLKAKAPK